GQEFATGGAAFKVHAGDHTKPRGPIASCAGQAGAALSRIAAMTAFTSNVQLGQSELRVPPICLGTMTFGEQVDEATSHAILDRALERGVDFLDTSEMYSVPTRKETFTVTETIIG